MRGPRGLGRRVSAGGLGAPPDIVYGLGAPPGIVHVHLGPGGWISGVAPPRAACVRQRLCGWVRDVSGCRLGHACEGGADPVGYAWDLGRVGGEKGVVEKLGGGGTRLRVEGRGRKVEGREGGRGRVCGLGEGRGREG